MEEGIRTRTVTFSAASVIKMTYSLLYVNGNKFYGKNKVVR